MKDLIKPEKFPFFYGWVIIFAGTVGMVMSIPGQTMGISVFTEDFIKSLKIDRTSLSQTYLVGTLCSASVITYFGGLYDKWGAKAMIVCICFFMSLALIYLSELEQIQQFGSHYLNINALTFILFCIGFFIIRLTGQGLMTTVSRSMMSKWFDVKRGLVLSISTIISSFIFSASPTFFKNCINTYGWQSTLFGMALVICPGMLVFGYLFFKDNPEKYGLHMDGLSNKIETNDQTDSKEKNVTLSEAVKTLTFWTYAITFTIPSLYGTAFVFHHVAVGKEFGFSSEEMGLMFLPIAVASAITSFISGVLSDKISLHTILKTLLISIIISLICLPYFDHPIGNAGLLIALGTSQGLFLTLMSVTWPKLFGRESLGKISSFGMAWVVFGSALGPYIFALSFEYTGSFVFGTLLLLPIPLTLLVLTFYLPKHK